MQLLGDYWLAILVGAVAVFLVSSVLHMALPIHKGDYQGLPQESDALEKLRALNLGPGSYSFPRPQSMKDMSSPEMIEKYKQGPVGMMTILPNGVPAVGTSLVLWFLYSVVINIFVAYVLYVASIGATTEPGAMTVFRLTSTVAILAYALGHFHDSIWKGQSWSTTMKFVFHGVVYGLITAVAFTWLS